MKVVQISKEHQVYDFVEDVNNDSQSITAISKTDTLMFLRECKKYYNRNSWWWWVTFRPISFHSFAKSQLLEYHKIRNKYVADTQKIRKKYKLKNKLKNNYIKLYFARKKLAKERQDIYLKKYFVLIEYFFENNSWFSYLKNVELESKEYVNSKGRVATQLRVVAGTLSKTNLQLIQSQSGYAQPINRETLTILLYRSFSLYKKLRKRKIFRQILSYFFSPIKK